jgi:trimethylamine--corrinoid protein Co-methyltransferase
MKKSRASSAVRQHGTAHRYSFHGLCGGTTPATLAGTLVVTNAEILGGIVLSQIINKGNPILYGTSTTIMDMTTATSPVGAPEHAIVRRRGRTDRPLLWHSTNVGGT